MMQKPIQGERSKGTKNFGVLNEPLCRALYLNFNYYLYFLKQCER